MISRLGLGVVLAILAAIAQGQIAQGQRHRRQAYYGMANGTFQSTSSTTSKSSAGRESVTVIYAFIPEPASSVNTTTSATLAPSSNTTANEIPITSFNVYASSQLSTVTAVDTYVTVPSPSASRPGFYGPPVGSGTAPGTGSAYYPSSVGTAASSSGYGYTYAPTTSAYKSAHPQATPENTTCGGATLDVLDASLLWWYTETYTDVVSTLSIQFNANDSQTGWTLLPATTTFDVTSALASDACTPTITSYDSDLNNTSTGYDCFSTPPPLAAETTVVTVDAVKTISSSSGNGTDLPNIATEAPTAVLTVASSAGTYSAGTPFVYFSEYEIATKRPTTHRNGGVGCASSTQTFTMTKPFSFEYTGEDVDGSLLVGEDVVGDVNPAFLRIAGVNQRLVVAGSWVAEPTVAVVVERTVQAQAVLAGHTETSESTLDVPSPTLPSFLTPIKPTAAPQTTAYTPRIEVSETSLIVPTKTSTSEKPLTSVKTNQNFVNSKTFIVSVGESKSTIVLSTPTNVASFVTRVGNQVVTAIAQTSSAQAQNDDNNHNEPSVTRPFTARVDNSNVVLNVPVPATQTVVTAVANGKTYTATAGPVQATGGGSGSNGNNAANNGGSGGGFDGLLSAIVSAVQQPTNALQVLTAALDHSDPTASAILAGIIGSGVGSGSSEVGSNSNDGAGSGSGNGGSGNGESGNGGLIAQPNRLEASPAKVITFGGATMTAKPVPAFVVGGQTALPGSAPITVSGTVISVPAGAGAIVIDGSTIPLAGLATTSTAFEVNGVAITEDPEPVFTISGQTLQAGGGPITVDGTRLSLAPGGTALVVGSSTSAIASAAAAESIPLITVGSRTFTANAATQYYFAPGQTLTPGGTVVVSGTTISLGSDAQAVVINGQTQTLSPPIITPAPAVTIGDAVYAPNVGSTYNIDGQLLTPGGVITVSGTTISLADGANNIVINGQTQTLTGPTGVVVDAATITAPPVLTIAGQAFAPNGGSTYLILDQTLTPGGVITFSGANGLETVSLDRSGTVLVEVISGVTTTSTIPGAGDISPTAAPVLTIGGQTFTALGGNDVDPTYVINGETLTPGAIDTVTVNGRTYIVSLSPLATVLVIQAEGPDGVVTATSFETLFPATNTRGTITMTGTGDSASATADSTQGGAVATGKGSGSQSSAPARLSMQLTSIILGLSTLLLAIWL